jgi:hypothetical protein
VKLPHPPPQWDAIFLQRYLRIVQYDTRYHLAFLLAGARVGARTALATGYVCPRDLDAMGLITPLPRCDVYIIQHAMPYFSQKNKTFETI